MNPLVLLALQELPAIISRLQELFHRDHPGEPQPTDVEVIAAYQSAYALSLLQDEAWLRANAASPPMG